MKIEEVVSIIGILLLGSILVYAIKEFSILPTGDVIFTDTKEVKISSTEQNPEVIELEKNIKTKVLIDDIKIKECFDTLNETQIEIEPIVFINNTLSFTPKKDGNLTFLCGGINTKIVVNSKKNPLAQLKLLVSTKGI